MATNKWLDRTQPQTLQIATMLMYINAAFDLLYGVAFTFPIGTILFLGSVAAGLGIANEKKLGYWLGAVIAFLPIVYIIWYRALPGAISLLFEIALVALLLHPMSRNYRKTWFK